MVAYLGLSRALSRRYEVLGPLLAVLTMTGRLCRLCARLFLGFYRLLLSFYKVLLVVFLVEPYKKPNKTNLHKPINT